MAYSKYHKIQTRQRILQQAYRQFVSRGYDRTSIERVMESSGLTRGAFYAYFRSKQELYACAMEHGGHGTGRRHSWAWELLDHCVDPTGLSKDKNCVPLTFFATDLGDRDPNLRAPRTKALKRTLTGLLAHAGGQKPQREAVLLSVAVMIVGAEVLAHTTDDKALIQRLRSACRSAASALLAEEPAPPSAYFWETGADAYRYL